MTTKMYIENFRAQQEKREIRQDESNFGFESEQPRREKVSNGMAGEVLFHWQAPEYESYDRDKKWYTVMTLGLIAIISYAFFTNSPIMAITFILIGMVEYIYISRDPQMLDFMITKKGIVAGKELYEFEQINSFWIFYDPEIIKSLSLHMKSDLMPFLQIPLHNEDPDEIREIISQYIPEVKQDYRLKDSINRMLRL